jgi:hypothetical protein
MSNTRKSLRELITRNVEDELTPEQIDFIVDAIINKHFEVAS